MQNKTLVLQSHQNPLPYQWLKICIHSVQQWADYHQFDYLLMDDQLFELVPPHLLQKTIKQKVIATDLARLLQLQYFLKQGYDCVIWCDADFLIFEPEKFILTADRYLLGREIWIQKNQKNKLKAYKKVHNAFLMFRQNNPFLDFYADTASRLLELNTGTMPAQFIGPKLLTAIHNISLCPVLETAGMLSPLVIKNIISGGGAALDLFKIKSISPLYAANLCTSSYQNHELSLTEIEQVIQILQSKKKIFLNI